MYTCQRRIGKKILKIEKLEIQLSYIYIKI
jgi:hypothetical protein